ncbi:ribosomal protein L22 [Pneumocystis murina B123]|uniref:Ribosomal protein L22 n=1 Tax=Pneumocystis murina (strain B123) TaxID=1069680 RepID=M7PCL0_PNEMU|nr:ribosomal protein L22 [Pneumocystis murina B123]EMR08199.1 ribosomal protein L22 [Pneumocystis murina B123]
MVRYASEPSNPAKSAKARGEHLPVHFKNTREVAQAIKGLSLTRAFQYLENVKEHKEAVPFRRFHRGLGRTAQGKPFRVTLARWPEKSVRFIVDLLNNAKSNADFKGLDIENLYITHIQVNRAPRQRQRTYRAHGRINPYMNSPCHIEIIVSEETETIKKADDSKAIQRNR